jgi:hypothetical protein
MFKKLNNRLGGEEMLFNYAKLKGRIVEKFETQSEFAKALGMSEHTLSGKLNNKGYFRQDQINKAISLLEIENDQATIYFFTPISSRS